LANLIIFWRFWWIFYFIRDILKGRRVPLFWLKGGGGGGGEGALNGVAPLAMPRRWRTVLKKKPSGKDSVIEGQPLLLFK
jgi:hypothetical protein